jgi:Carbohydrate-selective porin, OprB family/S-layer homology domain
MAGLIWKSLLTTPAWLGASALIAASASAQAVGQSVPTTDALQQVQNYSSPAPVMVGPGQFVGQVTSVSQLTDVKPTDWAFQALQSLVERYGCIAGYPDKTYRGNRALTRYEFAAGLNACLDRVNELIAAATADLVKKEDLDTLRKLQEEFAAELATLQGRVDGLEARTTTLEKQQFSTTTKLNAEVVFGLAGVLENDRALTTDQWRVIDNTPGGSRTGRLATAFGADSTTQANTIFGNRVRLNLDSSFTGSDLFRVRLQARNIFQFSGAVTGTNQTRLGFDGRSPGNDNTVEVSQVYYRFAPTKLTTVWVGGGNNDGIRHYDFIPTLSPIASSSSGSISRFGRFSPIYRSGAGSGIVINQKLGKEFSFLEKFTLSAAYLVPTPTASNPADKNGLFNGDYSALGQLTFQASPKLSIAATYANSYYRTGTGITGGTGTTFAGNPFNGVPTLTNSFGLEATYKVSPGFIVSGWGSFTKAEAKLAVDQAAVRDGDQADIWNWAVTLAFPDLFKEGNLAGIVFGQPPTVTTSDYGNRTAAGLLGASRDFTPLRRDNNSSFHLEAFYRYKLNDRIAVTPGMLVIFNPEGNNNNDTIFVGTIRTTFTF